MELTPEQKKAVSQWVEEGKSLADIQAGLRDAYGLSLTYMDVRFLVDDLELTLKDSNKSKDISPSDDLDKAAAKASRAQQPDGAPVEDDFASGLSVEVDRVTAPGSVVSGSVTFSDGVTAQWQVDQMGRLGLVPSQEGYQPSQEDIMSFQEELQNALQRRGF